MNRLSTRLFIVLTILLLLTSQVAYAERDREILRLGRGTSQIIQWRKDGEEYAVKTPASVEIRDKTGTLLNTLNFPEGRLDYDGTLQWSPNGAYIALILNNYSQEEGISIARIWSVNNPSPLLYTLITPNGAFTWKPDNTQFALGGRIYDVTTGQVVLIHKYGAECFSCGEKHDPKDRIYEGGVINWSPDGRRFISTSYASLGSSGYYRGVFDSANDNLLVNLADGRDSGSFVLTFLWSSDSSKFTDGYRIWNATNGQVITAFDSSQITLFYRNTSQSCNFTIPRWSRDNNSIFLMETACVDTSVTYSVLYRWDAASGILLSKQPFAHQIVSFEWEKGNLVARTQEGHRLVIDEMTSAVKLVDYTNVNFPVKSMAWSPDSKKLVSISIGSPNLPMQMWDVDAIRKGAKAAPTWANNTDWFNNEKGALIYPPDVAKIVWNNSGIVTVTEDPSYARFYHAVTQWDASDGHLQKYLYWSQSEFLPPTAEPSPDLKYLAVTNTHWLQDSGETSFPIEIIAASTK
ncbi:MAG: WD40 repeat domain-containing protein, partial [Anaerolineae bacterium]|nr:WD40 repeat domain-containing protein [Anaerolineae bacterium]